MARALLLEAPRALRLREEPAPDLAPARSASRRCVSGISHGTELSLYRGTSAFADRVFDRDLRAFVRPDPPRPVYPATLGYELVGTVEETGTDVHEFAARRPRPHRRAASRGGRARPRRRPPPRPTRRCGSREGPLERWLFVSVGAVALVAAHDARIKLGDHVAVIGLGAIGLLLVQMARLAGARRISVVDPVAARRELALALGADEAFDARRPTAGAAIKRSAGRGADVAVETSGRHRRPARRGRRAPGSAGPSSPSASTRAARPSCGSARSGTTTGSSMVSSMGAWGAPHRAYPAWDRPRVLRTVVDLLASGAVRVDALPVRHFPFEQAVDAYGWLDDTPERGGQGGVLDYPGGER